MVELDLLGGSIREVNTPGRTRVACDVVGGSSGGAAFHDDPVRGRRGVARRRLRETGQQHCAGVNSQVIAN